MRVLVTGVSGFVGGHLAEHLIAAGDLVVGLSASGRWPEELAHLSRAVRIERCDLTEVDEDDLAALIGRKRPEVIYHLAAQANPQASMTDPRGTWALNLGGTLNLLEAVKAAGLNPRPRVILVGSGVCYGNPAPEYLPVTERLPAAAEQPVFREQGRGRPAGHPALPGARHRRRDGPPVQPRRPAAVAVVRPQRAGAAGGRGRGRAQGPRRGRQPRRRPRLHRRPRRRPRLSPARRARQPRAKSTTSARARGPAWPTRSTRSPRWRRPRSRSSSIRRGCAPSISRSWSPIPPSSRPPPAGSRGSRSRKHSRTCFNTGAMPWPAGSEPPDRAAGNELLGAFVQRAPSAACRADRRPGSHFGHTDSSIRRRTGINRRKSSRGSIREKNRLKGT